MRRAGGLSHSVLVKLLTSAPPAPSPDRRALERLEAQHGAALPGQLAAFGISGRFDGALRRLFMSHPPIAERIAALRSGRYAESYP